MSDSGLMQELIEDALHLAKDEGQIEMHEYKDALAFVHAGFRLPDRKCECICHNGVVAVHGIGPCICRNFYSKGLDGRAPSA